MSLALLPVGILLPTLIGWLTLRLVEGKHAVLFGIERWLAGFALGSVLVPFLFFLGEVSGIGDFGLPSLLTIQLVTIAMLGGVYTMKKKAFGPSPHVDLDSPWPLWQKVIGVVLSLWLVAKLAAAWLLLTGPAFFDDTVKNWNLRGKMFYVHKELILEAIPGKGVGVGSYPPTVPLIKTWLATISGTWNEITVNCVHILWFLTALGLLYFVLRRTMRSNWAALGVYLLSSLPLYLVHGGAAYADQFLSLIIFIAVSWLYLGLEGSNDNRMSFLKISAIATGALVFTKNEALLLHLPPIAVLLVLAAVTGVLTHKEKLTAILWYSVSVLVVAGPWLVFKWQNSLTFGNAKSATGMLDMQWHEGVLETIFFNTFFMGHWLLLPALFVATLLVCRKTAFRTPLVVCTAFFLAVFLGQIPLYLFTALYTEALNQTGYTRGVLHLIPIAVLIVTVCLHQQSKKVKN